MAWPCLWPQCLGSGPRATRAGLRVWQSQRQHPHQAQHLRPRRLPRRSRHLLQRPHPRRSQHQRQHRFATPARMRADGCSGAVTVTRAKLGVSALSCTRRAARRAREASSKPKMALPHVRCVKSGNTSSLKVRGRATSVQQASFATMALPLTKWRLWPASRATCSHSTKTRMAQCRAKESRIARRGASATNGT